MIAKILPKPSKNFAGVNYNTNKIDRNKGELMRAANFGPLDAMTNLRPQDYINYFCMVSAQNKKISNPQFHAVLSAKGKSYSKDELTEIAMNWLVVMGYGSQPYLIVFHKDTDHNHVHVVTTRVGRDGKKISSAYEHVRSLKNLNRVLGYDHALAYRFSTRAQFYLLIERRGYLGKDYSEEKLQQRIDEHVVDKARIAEIRQLLTTFLDEEDFVSILNDRFLIELIFHSADGKKPYGYTIIDHESRQVFKGSEVLNLKYLNGEVVFRNMNESFQLSGNEQARSEAVEADNKVPQVYLGPIYIADDVDDQQVLGMKRRRQKKARTNTR